MNRLRQWIARGAGRTWTGWPARAYERSGSQQRLAAVQVHLADCLDSAATGRVRVLSMCAGDGRDVIGVLESHPRKRDAVAWLVEMDQKSVALGVGRATDAGLAGTINFLRGDATDSATYRNVAPGDIVLVCGVWGHVPSDERASLVSSLAALCRPGGAVIWTRGVRRGMERLHEIQAHFSGSCWQELRVSITPDQKWAVATYRYQGPSRALAIDQPIFHFQIGSGH
jgi:hypothetical protein